MSSQTQLSDSAGQEICRERPALRFDSTLSSWVDVHAQRGAGEHDAAEAVAVDAGAGPGGAHRRLQRGDDRVVAGAGPVGAGAVASLAELQLRDGQIDRLAGAQGDNLRQ